MACCGHRLLPEAATDCSVGASGEHPVDVSAERQKGVTVVLVVGQVAVSLLDSRVSELEQAVTEPDMASLETASAVYQLLVVEHVLSAAVFQSVSGPAGIEPASVIWVTAFAENFEEFASFAGY